MRHTLLAVLTLVACSEYELEMPIDPEAGVSMDTASFVDTSVTTDDTGFTDHADFDTEECRGGILATWQPGELVALSYDTGAAYGVLNSPEAGTFHVYDIAPAESGPSQSNESMYLRIVNDAAPTGQPLQQNCGGDWMVLDPDNAGSLPAGATQYLGTFAIEEGVNDVEMRHMCARVRAGECESLHNTVPADGSCLTSNVNSVHMTGEAICLKPA